MKSIIQRDRAGAALGALFFVMVVGAVAVGLWYGTPPATVQAESNFQRAFLEAYPTAHDTALDDCRLCHTQGAALNNYGADFATHGHSVAGIELLDSDGDGYRNVTEIEQGTMPGDSAARPAKLAPNAMPQSAPAQAAAGGVYKLIGWNDLGMHCMGPNYSNMSILPPYNTMWAQLILQGETPQIVTSGVKIEYAIENNTYSVGKTNFWSYANALFGVQLAPNIGLAGKGLAGTMDLAGDHFVALGIPVVPFFDGATPIPANWKPYQIAHLVAKDSVTGQVLAETRPVIPVSEEMNCAACHDDGMQENIRTGNVETNILTLHDGEEGTNLMGSRPVLCAKCHADNALGAGGKPGVPNLSRAMHGKHSVEGGGAPGMSDPDNEKPSRVNDGTNNCYLCHPGVKTQCLRDVMWAKGLTCTSCHGTTADVANPARNPWVDLPRCETCHGAQFAENAGLRYRDSKGHGGLYCEACHGSPHAILPSTQANDNIQNIALQGFAGTLKDCKVCHGTMPSGAGPHGLVPTPAAPSPTATVTVTPGATLTPTATATPPCGTIPSKPKLLSPANGSQPSGRRIALDWKNAGCVSWYNVTVWMDSAQSTPVVEQTGLTGSASRTPKLARGHTYFWRVQACNANGCANSRRWEFELNR